MQSSDDARPATPASAAVTPAPGHGSPGEASIGTTADASSGEPPIGEHTADETTTGSGPPGRRVTATHLAVIAVGVYVGVQLIANVTSIKIGSAFGRAVDMGTFVYPITFTVRDVVHKTLGKRLARTVVITAAAVNLFLAGYLQWVVRVRPDESFAFDDEFRTVLGPVWRIVVASIIAQVISELVDTEVYHWFVTRITAGYQWARVAVSNAVSVPLDNALFAVLAFGSLPFLADDAFTLPWSGVWDVFVVNLVVKGLVSAVSLPLIYVTRDRDWRADPADA